MLFRSLAILTFISCCDLLKIHYLCGDKDNHGMDSVALDCVVICSKFITFAVTKTTNGRIDAQAKCCDLLKIHYLCGDKDNHDCKAYRLF